jgi:hypothetical protein
MQKQVLTNIIYIGSQRPTAREGHVLVHLHDKNEYLLFSGISNTRFSDVYILSGCNNIFLNK